MILCLRRHTCLLQCIIPEYAGFTPTDDDYGGGDDYDGEDKDDNDDHDDNDDGC